ncbi:MAG: hypothetical protein NTY04_04095 [Candidatus Staskawiczbacteria bacterium]|nr:hypothetical protein [Candidatus Staskawiczbacteria bacterium]
MEIFIENLGICEHNCGRLVTTEGLAVADVSSNWTCGGCGKILTEKSFGRNKDGTTIKWVGPDYKWTPKKPEKSFYLGKWHIIVALKFGA